MYSLPSLWAMWFYVSLSEVCAVIYSLQVNWFHVLKLHNSVKRSRFTEPQSALCGTGFYQQANNTDSEHLKYSPFLFLFRRRKHGFLQELFLPTDPSRNVEPLSVVG